MNNVEDVYKKMVVESVVKQKTPTEILKNAKENLNESDDYLNDPEFKDLIENYSKSDLLKLVSTLIQ